MLQVEQHAQKYDTVMQCFVNPAGTVDVKLQGWKGEPFSVPLVYLQRAGGGWKQLVEMMQSMVNETGSLHHQEKDDPSAELPIDLNAAISAGWYAFRPTGDSFISLTSSDRFVDYQVLTVLEIPSLAAAAFSWRKGPQGATMKRPAQPDASIEDDSGKSRSTSTAGVCTP